MSYNPYNSVLGVPSPVPRLQPTSHFGQQPCAGHEGAGSPFIPYVPSHSSSVRPQSLSKQRRSSQSSRPYDAAQSPTRMRFHLQDANISHSPICPPEFPRRSRGSIDTSYHSLQIPVIKPPPANRRPKNENFVAPRGNHTLPGVHGPMNHMRVPQEQYDAFPVDLEERHPSISFGVHGFPEPGVKVSKVMATYIPAIINKDDQVLKGVFEKFLNIELKWPGYPPATKRLNTVNGTITRQDVIVSIAKLILDWAGEIQKQQVKVQPGYDSWALFKSINPGDLFITELVHRGTSHWQVELWTPSELM